MFRYPSGMPLVPLLMTLLLAAPATAPATRPAAEVVRVEQVMQQQNAEGEVGADRLMMVMGTDGQALTVFHIGDDWNATLMLPAEDRHETYLSRTNMLVKAALTPEQVDDLRGASADKEPDSPVAYVKALADDAPVPPDIFEAKPREDARGRVAPAEATAVWDEAPKFEDAPAAAGPARITAVGGDEDDRVRRVVFDNFRGMTGTTTFTYGGQPPPASLAELEGEYALPPAGKYQVIEAGELSATQP